MALNILQVKSAPAREKAYKLPDDRGMFLLVCPDGAKYWRMRYTFKGKENTLALGVYPDISLKDARERRDAARRALAMGQNPRGEAAKGRTFADVAEEWLRVHMDGVRTEGHVFYVRSRIRRFLLPELGGRVIRELQPTDILPILRRLQSGGIIETAHRVKQIAGQIFRYAVATGEADRDVTADLRGVLPPRQQKHRGAARTAEEAAAVMAAIAAYPGGLIVRKALYFSAYTFARPGEVRHAEWQEIEWLRSEWRIPAEKMKMRVEHVVPLSRQVVALLQEMHEYTGRGRYIFPSLRAVTSGNRPMSENTVNVALRTMGFAKEQMTAHGFRAMASTLLNENGFPPDVIERQLAHTERNKVRAAYNHAEYMQERKAMMQWWADYLDGLTPTPSNTECP